MTDVPSTRLRVAIVGLGPSGAYAAGHLLANGDLDVHVDAFERLLTPWGLVRSGVAPDHPNIKTVTRVYDKTAADPRFTYRGNVELGRDVSREDLLARYHAIIYAVGTPGDRPMAIPGEDLPGSAPATAFVGWYNGHPDLRDEVFDLSCRRAVVIGNGNVAIDVARMLTLTPAELARTDMADHAMFALARSEIEEVVVVGRRGPEQAAFTNPELRELGALAGADVAVSANEVTVPDAFREHAPSKASQRNLALLAEYATRGRRGHAKRIALRFLLSPTQIVGDRRVRGVELVRNRLERADDGSLRAHPTTARAVVSAGLVLRAVGYRGRPLPGVPFDAQRGVIANVGGRVVEPGGGPTREYVVGWAKRGPSGVIGTNKRCAQDTVRALVQDMVAGRLDAPIADAGAVRDWADDVASVPVTWADWETLDRHELQAGQRANRPRVKLTRVSDMLDVLHPAQREDQGSAVLARFWA